MPIRAQISNIPEFICLECIFTECHIQNLVLFSLNTCVTEKFIHYGRICAGCNTEIGHGRFLNCMSAFWHPECFRCHACNQPISDYEVRNHVIFSPIMGEISSVSLVSISVAVRCELLYLCYCSS